MTDIPHRFRESSFRRYEQVIASVVDAFPAALTFDPSAAGLAPTTFACRLRDAMKALNQYHWPTTQINMEKFETIYENIVVRESNGQIVVGDNTTSRTASQRTAITTSAVAEPLDTDLPPNAILLLAVLAHNRALSRPIRIVHGMTENDARYINDNFDLIATDNGDGSFTII